MCDTAMIRTVETTVCPTSISHKCSALVILTGMDYLTDSFLNNSIIHPTGPFSNSFNFQTMNWVFNIQNEYSGTPFERPPWQEATPLERPLDNVNLNINVLIFTPDERPPLLKGHFPYAKGVASQEGFHCT